MVILSQGKLKTKMTNDEDLCIGERKSLLEVGEPTPND